MGNTDNLKNQIMELRFISKGLQRQANKCEKNVKRERSKVKKAMGNGNMEEARIYAENTVRNHNERLNHLRLAARLDAVISRLQTQAKVTNINTFLGHIVKALDFSKNRQPLSETMALYDKHSLQMAEQFELIEKSTSKMTPEDQVKTLMQQVAHDCGLDKSISRAGHAVPAMPESSKIINAGQPRNMILADLLLRTA